MKSSLPPVTEQEMAKGQRNISHLPSPHQVTEWILVVDEGLPMAKNSSLSFAAIVIPTLPRMSILIQGSMNAPLPQTSLHCDISLMGVSGTYKAALNTAQDDQQADFSLTVKMQATRGSTGCSDYP